MRARQALIAESKRRNATYDWSGTNDAKNVNSLAVSPPYATTTDLRPERKPDSMNCMISG
jgi:hypothetical protein